MDNGPGKHHGGTATSRSQRCGDIFDCDHHLVAGNAGFCRNIRHQRRRHRVDDRRDRAGADDDHPGPGAVLLRHGAQEERIGDDGAVPRRGRADFNSLGGIRIFAGVRRRRSVARHARPLVSRRHEDGRHQSRRQDDPGSIVHAVSDDVCDHHGSAGRGCGCRSDAVLGLSPVFGRLVHVRLRSAGALGLGVHLSAGTGGLVAAKVMGRRHGYGTENLAPFDLSLAVIGTGMLWVGWFGFIGGSALTASPRAVMAITATHLAACAGALTWGAIEWSTRRKPSVLGMISGAVAGLGTITPASGFVAPWHGIVIGIIAGLFCFWACTSLKQRFSYDDSLDVFGVHGVGGLTGTLLAGVFATTAIGGTSGLIEGNPQQLLIQLYGVAVTLLWSGAVTFILLKLVGAVVPLRVSLQQELEGLDISQHGEALQ